MMILRRFEHTIAKPDNFHIFSLQGLFGRGLRTRILGNAIQSVMFTVIWRGLAERIGSSEEEGRGSRRGLKENKTDEASIEVEEADVPIEEERF